MEKFSELVGALFILALVVGGAFFYTVFAYSYVADIMWSWFALPYFDGIPDFTQIQFVAFFALKSILFKSASGGDKIKDEYKKDDKVNGFVMAFLSPWLILFFGWIIKVFVF